MGQSPYYAAVMDVQIKSLTEEYASGMMGQSTNYAAAKDAQIKFREEECAGGMRRIAIPRKK